VISRAVQCVGRTGQGTTLGSMASPADAFSIGPPVLLTGYKNSPAEAPRERLVPVARAQSDGVG
jgi:hypothetical protein